MFSDLTKLQGKLRTITTLYAAFATEIARASTSNPKTFEELTAKANGFAASLTKLNGAGEKMTSIQRQQLTVLKQVSAQLNNASGLNKLSVLMEQFTKHVQAASEALGRLSANASASTASQQQAVQGTQQAAQAMAQAKQALDAQASSYDALAAEIDAVMGSRRQNIQRMIEEQNAVRQLNKEIKDLTKYQSQGSGLSAAQQSRLVQLNDALLKHKTALADVRQNLNNVFKLNNAAATSMNGMSQSLGRMRMAYRELTDAERESSFGRELLASIQQTDAKLKALDAKLGNYQRNVGNYASGWNGLGMSIQQIGRELPSLAMGWNTFFLAISNNLPILTDEISRARKEYDALKKSGQQGTPVWKQVVSSVLSWQTAMVVGITVLSMYGKEIINWISGLFGADEAQKRLNESVKEFNSLAGEGQARARMLLETIRESEEGTKGRADAIQQFNNEYGKYLSNMLSENASLIEIEQAYKRVNQALMENAALKAKQSAIDKVLEENIEKQADALAEIQESVGAKNARAVTETVTSWTEEYRKAGAAWEKAFGDIVENVRKHVGKLPEDFYSALEDYVRSVYDSGREIENIQAKYNPFFNEKEANKAETKNKKYWERQRSILVSELESLSDIEAQGAKGLGIKARINDIDSRLNMFRLSSSEVEAADDYAAYIKKVTEDLTKSRVELMREGRDKEVAEIKADYDARMAEITGNTKDEIELRANLEALKQRAIAEVDAKYAKELLELDKQNAENRLVAIAGNNERELSERLRLQLELNAMMRDAEVAEAEKNGAAVSAVLEKYEKAKNDIVLKNLEERFGLIQAGTDAEIRQQELASLKEANALKKQYAEGKMSREEYERGMNEITLKYSKLRLQALIDEANAQLKLAGLTDSQRKDIETRIDELQTRLDGLDLSSGLSDVKDDSREFSDAMRLLEGSMCDSLGESNDMLTGMIGLFKELSTEGKKSAVSIGEAVMQIAGGLSSVMNDIYQGQIDQLDEEQEANEEAYDKELERIEALQEAGAISAEEAEARKRAAEDKTKVKEQQIAKQKAQLEQKQARWDKANSIIQATIATALAVTKALPNLVLAAVVGAMGAAQIAMISAQSIPKYAKGTNDHPGGLAIVGDGGRPEGIVTRDGAYLSPSTPTLIDLPRHAQVIPDLSAITSLKGLRSDYGLLEKQLAGGRGGVSVNVDSDFTPLERKMSENTKELKQIRKLMRKRGVRDDFARMAARV